MFYFIPAWQNSQVEKTDDMLSLIKIFQNTNENYRVLLRDYIPNLRTFLFLEAMSENNCVSLFDQMQNINQNYQNKIDVYDLNWPHDASFIYSQFGIHVLRGPLHYAAATFDELNNICRVEYFDDYQQIKQKVFIDDRGFISCIEYYEQSQMVLKEYYNEFFELQFYIDYKQEGKVFLGNKNKEKYQKEFFCSMDEFTEYSLSHYLQNLKEDDVLVVSMDNHIFNILNIPENHLYKIVSSAFSHRAFDYYSDKSKNFLNKSTLVIVDNHRMQKELQTFDSSLPIEILTPYDTVLRLGESQRVGYYLINYLYHGLDMETQNRLLYTAIDWHQKYGWHFTIQCMSPYYVDELKIKFIAALANYYDVEISFVEELIEQMNQQQENRELDEEYSPIMLKKLKILEKTIEQINFVHYPNKEELLKGLLHTRIIVDLAEQPDVLTQICGISSGIPMINTVDTGYVLDRKNGWIISSEDELEEALKFYLTGLRHWNEALVYSVSQLNHFTNGAIVDQWKELLQIG